MTFERGLLHTRIVKGTVGGAIAVLSADSATAQSLPLKDIVPDPSIADNSIMLIVFVGAFAFAMWSATWLIRERRQLDENNRNTTLELADLRARHERAQALLDAPDQRIVIWEGREEAPVCRGALPSNTGAPEDTTQFIGFGTWMDTAICPIFRTSR